MYNCRTTSTTQRSCVFLCVPLSPSFLNMLLSHAIVVFHFRFILFIFYCDYGKIKWAWVRSSVDTALKMILFARTHPNRHSSSGHGYNILYFARNKNKNNQWIWGSDQLANLKMTMVTPYRHNRRRWSTQCLFLHCIAGTMCLYVCLTASSISDNHLLLQ